MPVFEFRCAQCSSRFARLVGMTADSSEPSCPRCGSRELEKLISRFARLRSEDEVLDELEDSALSADIDDPASVHRWMREVGRQLDDGEEDGFEEFLEETEREMIDGSGDEDVD